MKKRFKIKVALLLTLVFLITSVYTFESDASGKKATVYVISKIDYVGEMDSTVEEFSYNSKGFVTNVKDVYFDQSWKYYYDSKCNIKKFYFASNSNSGYYSYFYYKNGKLTKQVQKKRFGNENCTMKYYWKKNLVSKIKINLTSLNSNTLSYKYDKKGNVIYKKSSYKKSENNNSGNSSSYSTHYSLQYKKGRLVNRDSSSEMSQKITYKKITVPKKYVSKIKKQQWYFRNQMLKY